MPFDRHWMTFPGLSAAAAGFRHRFTLRHPAINVNAERHIVVERLWDWHRDQVEAMGFPRTALRTAEQVHGTEVAVVSARSPENPIAGTDGLVSDSPGIALGIYVADCCAVFLADPVTGSFGLVHSGKRGAAGGISITAIRKMGEHFGAEPQDIIVELSPCIRPPAYEIDFAADIRQQCLDAGIQQQNLHDEGICTSADPRRFYSYRMEKGRTGRMLAVLGRIA